MNVTLRLRRWVFRLRINKAERKNLMGFIKVAFGARLEVTSVWDMHKRKQPYFKEEEPKRIEEWRIAALTEDERQIIALVTMGLNDRQISETLVVDETKVHEQLRVIFSKLDVMDRFELALYALYYGIVRMPH